MIFSSDSPNKASLSQQEKIARLRLIRTENIGPVTFRHLINQYGSGEKALEMLPELARRGGRKKPLKATPEKNVLKELDELDKVGGELLVIGDSAYPSALAATEDAPPVLFALGHTHLLDHKIFGIVGSRNSSAVGLKQAQKIAYDLGQASYKIVSGMARGIDAAVHQGSITTGTIAILAGGADVVYPRENAALYDRIKAEGLILSEMPLGTQPQARHFPRRNRIISGLSLGILVVEANHRSGSLITARQALEQGREVFAIPGSPMDPRAKGPNSLIRQGAVLTESASDILEVLAMMDDRHISEPQLDLFSGPGKEPAPESDLADARPQICEKLSHTPTSVDELIRMTELSPSVVQTVLLELELAGEISRHPGNRVAFC